MNLKILEQVFFGNRILDYIIAVSTLSLGLLFVKVVVRAFIKRLKKLAEKTTTTFDDLLVKIIERIVLPALYLSCIYISLKTLKMPAGMEGVINAAELAVITFFVTRIVLMFINYGLNLYLHKKQEDITLVRSLEGMSGVVKYLIWALAVIIFLDNIGFKVSTIIAGLGIGGIAVAIAAQALLKDFFSYFSIVFDRPFKLGDFIIIGDFMGTVEHIGIKTTRIRSLGVEQVIIKNTKDTAFDRAHFFSYGNFSLIFEVVYYVIGPDYNKYMDIQQEINFAIKEEFEKRGIEFAYPTQTLFLQKT